MDRGAHLLAVIAATRLVACSNPSGASSGAGCTSQNPAAARGADRFSQCVAQLMTGEEVAIRRNVEARYRLSADDAHDLVHDALLTVCVQHAERGYVNLGAALQRAVDNRATDNWRRKRR